MLVAMVQQFLAAGHRRENDLWDRIRHGGAGDDLKTLARRRRGKGWKHPEWIRYRLLRAGADR